MSLKNRFSQFAALAFVLVLAACANQKEPATAAINSIESAISAASADASKYVPDQLADVQSKFGALKDSFSKQDYKAVLAGAPAVLSAAQGLAAAAAAKKDEIMKALTGDWTQLSGALPNLVSAVKSRVDILSKSRKLPAPPMALATAPTHDIELDKVIGTAVAATLIARVAGKQVVTTVGRRVPLLGGVVGAGADGYATWRVGRYADRELLRRPRA